MDQGEILKKRLNLFIYHFLAFQLLKNVHESIVLFFPKLPHHPVGHGIVKICIFYNLIEPCDSTLEFIHCNEDLLKDKDCA